MDTTAIRRNLGVALSSLLILTGCATGRVVESVPLDTPTKRGFVRGPVYFLPKALIEVKVERKLNENSWVDTLSIKETPEFFPDTTRSFRADYDRNAFSEDAQS